MIPSLISLVISLYTRECTVKYTPRLEVILNELNLSIPYFRMIYYANLTLMLSIQCTLYCT